MSLPKPYYQDNAVTLYHGDCFDIIPFVDADAIITDPPYSISIESEMVGKKGRGKRRFNFFDGDTDWKRMTEDVVKRIALASMLPSVKTVYAWCGHRQFGPLVESFETNGFMTRPVVWKKACPVPAPPGVGFDSALELCIYAFKNGRVWTPPTGAKVPNFIEADSYRHGQPGKVDHPTQKPMDTALIPIMYSTNEGQTVLDPFAGSGTTGRACKDLGRKCVMIEREEKYCEIAAKRMRQEVLPL